MAHDYHALTRPRRQGGRLPSAASRANSPLGFLQNQDGRIVLLLFGLRLTAAGQVLLDGYFELLATARERYGGEEERQASPAPM